LVLQKDGLFQVVRAAHSAADLHAVERVAGLARGKNAGKSKVLGGGGRPGRQDGPLEKGAASQFGFHSIFFVSSGRQNCKPIRLAKFMTSVTLRFPFSGI
jgi:hypothetical protein